MKQHLRTFTFDATLARLRERAEQCGYGIDDEYCPVCSCQLTVVDVELGACTNCGFDLIRDDEPWVDDEVLAIEHELRREELAK